VSCAAFSVPCNHGPVISIFRQFGGIVCGPTNMSAVQLEAYMNNVNDWSLKIDNKGQQITTNDGYEFPLYVCNSLAYLEIRPYTD